MIAPPTLAEIFQRPELIDGLSPAVCGALVIQAAGLQERLGVRMATALVPVPIPAADELLDLAAAARLLNISLRTLRNRTTREPYRSLRVNNGTRYVRFSAARIAAYIRGEPLAPTRGDLGLPSRRKGRAGSPRLASSTDGLGRGGATA